MPNFIDVEAEHSQRLVTEQKEANEALILWQQPLKLLRLHPIFFVCDTPDFMPMGPCLDLLHYGLGSTFSQWRKKRHWKSD
jgi:hypothetical protein